MGDTASQGAQGFDFLVLVKLGKQNAVLGLLDTGLVGLAAVF